MSDRYRPPTVVCLGGTSETFSGDTRLVPPLGSMLEAVTRLLPDSWPKVWVPYPAVYAQGPGGYGASVEAGVLAAARAVDAAEGRVYLLGFSQGATSAGNLARRIQLGQFPALSLSGVGLIADPLRHRSQGFPGQTSGYGIGGERWIDPGLFPVWQAAAPGDPICRLPAGNALRSLADLSEFYAPGHADVWIADLRAKLEAGRFQRWWDLRGLLAYSSAAAWLRGYLFDGRHTCYARENVPGLSRTWTAELARLLVLEEAGRLA